MFSLIGSGCGSFRGISEKGHSNIRDRDYFLDFFVGFFRFEVDECATATIISLLHSPYSIFNDRPRVDQTTQTLCRAFSEIFLNMAQPVELIFGGVASLQSAGQEQSRQEPLSDFRDFQEQVGGGLMLSVNQSLHEHTEARLQYVPDESNLGLLVQPVVLQCK